MTRTITAFFDTTAEAERAAQDLLINVGGVRGEVYDAKRAGELSGLSIPGEDRATFDEGIRRGGAVLHAQVPDHRFDAVADVLERDGAVDIDEREAAWRKEGWTGGTTAGGTAGLAPPDTSSRQDFGNTGAMQAGGGVPAQLGGLPERGIERLPAGRHRVTTSPSRDGRRLSSRARG